MKKANVSELERMAEEFACDFEIEDSAAEIKKAADEIKTLRKENRELRKEIEWTREARYAQRR